MTNRVLAGLAAGAAGTTALNAVTYLDMALLARPASSTPEETVRKTEELAHLSLSAKGGPNSEEAANRRSGLGALMGIAAGLGTGAMYAVARPHLQRVPLPVLGVLAGLAANIGTTGPMAAFGITDPRAWPAESWLRDLVPHLAYGLATAAVYERLRKRSQR
jgi:drug/metabolite transporter (DMT)-like permease